MVRRRAPLRPTRVLASSDRVHRLGEPAARPAAQATRPRAQIRLSLLLYYL